MGLDEAVGQPSAVDALVAPDLVPVTVVLVYTYIPAVPRGKRAVSTPWNITREIFTGSTEPFKAGRVPDLGQAAFCNVPEDKILDSFGVQVCI